MKKIISATAVATVLACATFTSCGNKENTTKLQESQAQNAKLTAEIATVKKQLTTAKEKIKALTPPDTHFRQVTKHLDYDGDYFSYSKVDGIKPIVESIITVIDKIGSAEISNEKDIRQFKDLLQLAHVFMEEFGIYDIDAKAASAVTRDGYYHNKMLLHATETDGALFKLLGGNSHDLTSLKFLPENTLLAVSGDIKLKAIWDALKKVSAQSTNPQIKGSPDLLAAATGMLGINLEDMLKEQSGEVGLFITSDLKEEIVIPATNGPMTIPQAAMTLVLARQGNLLNDFLDTQLPAELETVEIGDFTLMSMPPVPTPLKSQFAIARSQNYFLVSTNINSLKKSLHNFGDSQGLIATKKFNRLSNDIPKQGNSYAYIDPKTVPALIDYLMNTVDEDLKESAQVIADAIPKNIFYYGVTQVEPYGLSSVNNFTFRNDTFESLPLQSIAYLSTLSSTLFPTLNKMQRKAMANNQANNLKQIGFDITSIFNDVRKSHIPKDLAAVAKDGRTNLDNLIYSTFNKGKKPTQGINGDINFLAAGKRWIDVNSSITVVAYIDYPNKDNIISILFGDCHVETFTGTFDQYCELNPNCLPK